MLESKHIDMIQLSWTTTAKATAHGPIWPARYFQAGIGHLPAQLTLLRTSPLWPDLISIHNKEERNETNDFET